MLEVFHKYVETRAMNIRIVLLAHPSIGITARSDEVTKEFGIGEIIEEP